MAEQQVITLKQLAKHNKADDAWMALKGKVYDVTFFVKKHPGGPVSILQYAGRDATAKFYKVHPYVNFKKSLHGHEVGVLDPADIPPGQLGEEFTPATGDSCFSCFKGTTISKKNPRVKFYDSLEHIACEVEFVGVRSEAWDWTIAILDNTLLIRKVLKESTVWHMDFPLPITIKHDDIAVKMQKDNCFCTTSFAKPKGTGKIRGAAFSNLDSMDSSEVDSRSLSDRFDAWLVYKKKLTHDTSLYGIQTGKSAILGFPLGFHCKICIDDLERPYTPVCASMDSRRGTRTRRLIYFIIKTYEVGGVSEKISKIPVDKGDSSKLKLSQPHGFFDFSFIRDKTLDFIYMFAGGTGITPLTRIIRWMLDLDAKSTKIILMFWNKTESDIIWKKEFDRLSETDYRFVFIPVITAETDVVGIRYYGRPSKALVQTMLQPYVLKNLPRRQAYVCGPAGFTNGVLQSIEGIVKKEDTVAFEG